MPQLMRCQYCGLLQDEPAGVKTCPRCGGELAFEPAPSPGGKNGYVRVQMELDQVMAPGGRNVDRYLLVTLRTPETVPPEEAAPTDTGRQPINFAAVLDVSGSMRGPKLEQAIEAARQALQRLHDGDTFSLVTFASKVRVAIAPTVIAPRTRRKIESTLRKVSAGGQTALDGGLDRGLKEAAAEKRETNLVLLLSDGQANVGETDVELVGKRGYDARQQGFIVSTLGVGADYNEALMAEIATEGGGRFYHVLDAGQIAVTMAGELGEVAALAARDATIRITIPAGATVFPLSSAYPAEQGGGQATISLGDIPSDVELEIPIRLTLPTQSVGTRLSVEGALDYRSPAGNPLSAPLNRVTVRFTAAGTFGQQDGVVVPVVERVLGQMRAANVLGVSRAMAKSPGSGEQRAEEGLAALRDYALRLGEQRADQEMKGLRSQLTDMRAAPAAAKSAVAAAFARQRSTKKFGK